MSNLSNDSFGNGGSQPPFHAWHKRFTRRWTAIVSVLLTLVGGSVISIRHRLSSKIQNATQRPLVQHEESDWSVPTNLTLDSGGFSSCLALRIDQRNGELIMVCESGVGFWWRLVDGSLVARRRVARDPCAAAIGIGGRQMVFGHEHGEITTVAIDGDDVRMISEIDTLIDDRICEIALSEHPEMILYSYKPGPNSSRAAATYVDNRETHFAIGHTGDIWSVGCGGMSTLLTASHDGTVRLWKLPDCQPISCFLGHKWAVEAATASSDGKHLASGDIAGIINIWDSEHSEPVSTLCGHDGGIPALRWCGSANILVSVSDEERGGVKVVIWDVARQLPLCALTHQQLRFRAMAVSDDGNLLAIADCLGRVYIWDVRRLLNGDDKR
jgi:hypothetical protein